MTEQITQIDFSILYWIQNTLRCEILDFIMPKITFLGNAGLIWLITACAMLFTKNYRKTGIFLFIGLAVGVLIGNIIMKNLFARPRPCWINTTVQLLISMPKDFSFPSGHTLSSVISAIILTSANHRFGFIAIPLAVLIAFSRLYLFVHFPTDVLISVILGFTIGFTLIKIGRLA